MLLDLASASDVQLFNVVRGIVKQAELPPLPEDWKNRISKILSDFRIFPPTPF